MCDGNHTTRFKQDCVDGLTGHSWTSRGSNHGVPAVFTIIIIVIIVLDFATEFGSYPPLKVIYHPAGFYNSAVSFLWKTRCSIIIIIITYTVWTRWIEGRGTMGMPRPHSTTDLPAPDCLVQVNRNWSDFLSVKSNASSPYNSTKLMNEWSPRRRISFENTRPPSGKQRNYSYTYADVCISLKAISKSSYCRRTRLKIEKQLTRACVTIFSYCALRLWSLQVYEHNTKRFKFQLQ